MRPKILFLLLFMCQLVMSQDTSFVTYSNSTFQSLQESNNKRVSVLEHELKKSNQLADNKMKALVLKATIDTTAFARLGGNAAKLAAATTERFGVGMNTVGGNNKSFNVGINPYTGYTNAIGSQNLFAYDIYNPTGKTYASLHRAANGDKRFLYSQKSTQAGTGVPAYYDYALVKDSATNANIQVSEYADNNGLYRKSVKTAKILGNTYYQKEWRISVLPSGVTSDLGTLSDGSIEYRVDSGRYFVQTLQGVKHVAYLDDIPSPVLPTEATPDYLLRKLQKVVENYGFADKIIGDFDNYPTPDSNFQILYVIGETNDNILISGYNEDGSTDWVLVQSIPKYGSLRLDVFLNKYKLKEFLDFRLVSRPAFVNAIQVLKEQSYLNLIDIADDTMIDIGAMMIKNCQYAANYFINPVGTNFFYKDYEGWELFTNESVELQAFQGHFGELTNGYTGV
jgi:hypothetical protein